MKKMGEAGLWKNDSIMTSGLLEASNKGIQNDDKCLEMECLISWFTHDYLLGRGQCYEEWHKRLIIGAEELQVGDHETSIFMIAHNMAFHSRWMLIAGECEYMGKHNSRTRHSRMQSCISKASYIRSCLHRDIVFRTTAISLAQWVEPWSLLKLNLQQ